LIAGVETYALKGRDYRREPRLWIRAGSGWVRTALPGLGATTEGQLSDAVIGGVAVGNSSGRASVWTPVAGGGWSVAAIGPSGSDALAINRTGTLIVGNSGGSATYWSWNGAGWVGPVPLAGACAAAVGVAGDGRIIANGCARPDVGITSVIIQAPYGPGDVRYLSGFGDRLDGPQAEAISPNGQWIVGRAVLRGSVVGAYWNLF